MGDYQYRQIRDPISQGSAICFFQYLCLGHSDCGKVSDGPNGARGGDFFDGTTAACFPACVSLATTFNRDLSRRIGVALAEEAQTKGAYALLGPTVCGHRSPLGGRNFESFSEDPLLTGLLASEYVRGLQSERVAATVKHFVANEQDTKRFSVNEKISQRALR